MSEPDQPSTYSIVRVLEDLIAHVPHTDEPLAADPRTRSRELAAKAAREAALISGGLSLPPGPLGVLTIIPDLVAIWRIQSRMVADIAGAFGRQASLSREQMLYCLFRHAASQALRDIVVRSGERLILQTVTPRLIRRIGTTLTQRLVGRTALRWLPLVGALGVAAYAWFDTDQVARTAIDLFADEHGALSTGAPS